VIQVHRPVREIEEIVQSRVTGVRFTDGRIWYDIILNGEPRTFSEEPWQAFQALRVTGATLMGVEMKNGNVYYTLTEVGQAYTPGGFLEHAWWSRDHLIKKLTGVHLAGDGVDYEVLDGGQPGVVHETEVSVLSGLRLWGVRITGVELKDGSVYYTLAESSVTARAS
jgi:hypothetical protein